MKASWVSATGVLLAGVVALGSAGGWSGRRASAQTQRGGGSLADAIPPHFEADPSWLQPLPPGKSLPELKPVAYGRPSVSVATGLHDHVWIRSSDTSTSATTRTTKS